VGINMPFVRRYKDLGTDLNALYKDIVKELQNTKELNVARELEGEINGQPFKSVTAVRASIPRAFIGALREVTVTLTGKPDDYVMELHTGAWLSNMLLPGTGGLLIAGPLGGVAVAGTTAIVAAQYQRTLKNKVKDLVKKNSKKEYTDQKIETFA